MSRLNVFGIILLPSHECNVCGLHKKPSTVALPQAEMGYFANQRLTERGVTGLFYSMWVYQFSLNALSGRDVDGEVMMAVSREQLQIFAKRLPKQVFSLYEKLNTVRLVPARFIFARLINGNRSISFRRGSTADVRPKGEWCGSVKFVGIVKAGVKYTTFNTASV